MDNYPDEELRLKTLHHEYTHFLHVVLTNNKDNFWESVVYSEFDTGRGFLEDGIIKNFLANLDFKSNPNPIMVGMYDFSNPYVCFAECFAYWYSWVAYSNGVYGRKYDSKYQDGIIIEEIVTSSEVFIKLIDNKVISANQMVDLIYNKDINTFTDFEFELVQEYPEKKEIISKIFIDHYYFYEYYIN